MTDSKSERDEFISDMVAQLKVMQAEGQWEGKKGDAHAPKSAADVGESSRGSGLRNGVQETWEDLGRFDFHKPSKADAMALASELRRVAGKDGLRGGDESWAAALTRKVFENCVYFTASRTALEDGGDAARAELCAVVMIKLVRSLLWTDAQTLQSLLGSYTPVMDDGEHDDEQGSRGCLQMTPSEDPLLGSLEARTEALVTTMSGGSSSGNGKDCSSASGGDDDNGHEVWAAEEDDDDFVYEDGNALSALPPDTQQHHHQQHHDHAEGGKRVTDVTHVTAATSEAAGPVDVLLCLSDMIQQVSFACMSALPLERWLILALTEDVSVIINALKEGNCPAMTSAPTLSSSPSPSSSSSSSSPPVVSLSHSILGSLWPRYLFLLRDMILCHPCSLLVNIPPIINLLSTSNTKAGTGGNGGVGVAANNSLYNCSLGGALANVSGVRQEECISLLALSSLCRSNVFRNSTSTTPNTVSTSGVSIAENGSAAAAKVDGVVGGGGVSGDGGAAVDVAAARAQLQETIFSVLKDIEGSLDRLVTLLAERARAREKEARKQKRQIELEENNTHTDKKLQEKQKTSQVTLDIRATMGSSTAAAPVSSSSVSASASVPFSAASFSYWCLSASEDAALLREHIDSLTAIMKHYVGEDDEGRFRCYPPRGLQQTVSLFRNFLQLAVHLEDSEGVKEGVMELLYVMVAQCGDFALFASKEPQFMAYLTTEGQLLQHNPARALLWASLLLMNSAGGAATTTTSSTSFTATTTSSVCVLLDLPSVLSKALALVMPESAAVLEGWSGDVSSSKKVTQLASVVRTLSCLPRKLLWEWTTAQSQSACQSATQPTTQPVPSGGASASASAGEQLRSSLLALQTMIAEVKAVTLEVDDDIVVVDDDGRERVEGGEGGSGKGKGEGVVRNWRKAIASIRKDLKLVLNPPTMSKAD